MFQTKPYKALNQIKHKNRQLVDQFKLALLRIHTPQTLNKDVKRIKINKFVYRSQQQRKMQKTIYKKDFQPPLMKIWNAQYEKIIKSDKTKNLPFYSSNKIFGILETYPEIKYKISFFVYPSNEYQAINISYKEFVQKYFKINYDYIALIIKKKDIIFKVFQKLCQCLKLIDMFPIYSTGLNKQNTIEQILKQNNLIFKIHNQKADNLQQITRQKIYQQKFELYRRMMEQQENQQKGRKNFNAFAQKIEENIEQKINQSFLSQLHKKETFSEEWIKMIKQKQKNGYQELQKNKLFNNLPSFKRGNRDKKLDNILQSIQKFKKQSQYMIKMLQDRLSY